jgi:hypothetical protein
MQATRDFRTGLLIVGCLLAAHAVIGCATAGSGVDTSSDDSGAADTGQPPTSDATTPLEDGTFSNDIAEASEGEGGDGAPEGGPLDSGAADGGADCGPLDLLTNCGACGVVCAAPDASGVALASCILGGCHYQCEPGYLDCNGPVAANTDGCECATPGSTNAKCCGHGCPTAHTAGFSMSGPATFYDCETTIDQGLALDACGAYAGSVGYCIPILCGAPDGGSGDQAVCNRDDPNRGPGDPCTCWDFDGAYAGWARKGSSAYSCECPSGKAGEVRYH